jgi:ornithine cyclodeaminase
MNTIDADQVRAATPWPALIAAIADELARGGVVAPERHIHSLDRSEGDQALLLMPSWVPGDLVVVKTVTYFAANAGSTVPTVSATVLAFDGADGQLAAVIDGDQLTARRTAACSALAGRYLARPSSSRLLVVGTGQLAPNMVRAHASVHDLTTIEVWGRRPARAAEIVELLVGEGFPARVSDDLERSVARADLVSCVTGATEPLVTGAWLRPGAHLDLVGGFQPDMREADDEAVSRSTIFVDTLAGAMVAGDLAQPLADGVITESSISGDLRELATGQHRGRSAETEITVLKSAGFAIADLAAARLVLGSLPRPGPAA